MVVALSRVREDVLLGVSWWRWDGGDGGGTMCGLFGSVETVREGRARLVVRRRRWRRGATRTGFIAAGFSEQV